MVSLSYKTVWKRINCTVQNVEFWGKKWDFSIPDSDEADNVLRVIKQALDYIK